MQSIVNTVISEMGPRILSRQPPGFTLLLLDLIFAADRVLSSADIRTVSQFTLFFVFYLICWVTNSMHLPGIAWVKSSFIVDDLLLVQYF